MCSRWWSTCTSRCRRRAPPASPPASPTSAPACRPARSRRSSRRRQAAFLGLEYKVPSTTDEHCLSTRCCRHSASGALWRLHLSGHTLIWDCNSRLGLTRKSPRLDVQELDEILAADKRPAVLLAGFTWCRPCKVRLIAATGGFTGRQLQWC